MSLNVKLNNKYEIKFLPILVLLVCLIILYRERDYFLFSSLLTLFAHFFTHAATDGFESQRFAYDVEFIFFILLGVIVNFLSKPDNKLISFSRK